MSEQYTPEDLGNAEMAKSQMAEMHLVSAIFQDPSRVEIAIAAGLSHEDFWVSPTKAMYHAMTSLHERGEPITAATVEREGIRLGHMHIDVHQGSVEYVMSWLNPNTDAGASVDANARLLVEASARRRVAEASRYAFHLAAYGDLADVAADVERAMVEAIERCKRHRGTPELSELVKANFLRMQAMLDHPESFTGLPMGLSQIDSMLGCLRPGNLIVVGARPGVGKTGYLLQCARNIAASKSVACGVFSLEMNADELVMRWMAREAGVDHMKLLTANMEDWEWRKLIEASQAICKWPIVIDDAPQTISQLRSRARFMVREQGVRAIFVDYLQLVRVGGQASAEKTREREVGEVSSALKNIAKELRVPVVAAAQLSRASERREGRKPKLSDLRESGSIEQDADAVMFLHRDPDAATEADRETTEAIIAKNRHGPTGVVNMRFHSQQAWFEEDDGSSWTEKI